MGEIKVLPKLCNGARADWVNPLIDETTLTPRKSKVIKSKEVTSRDTSKSLARFVPLVAIFAPSLIYEALRSELSQELRTLQRTYQNLQPLREVDVRQHESACWSHDGGAHLNP